MHGAVGDSDDSQRLAQQKRYDGDNELLFRMFVEQVPGNGQIKACEAVATGVRITGMMIE